VAIDDVVDVYKRVLLDVLDNEGQTLPAGKKGIIFSAGGENTKIHKAELVAKIGHELGVLPDTTVEHISLEVAAKELLPLMGLFSQEQIDAAGPQIAESVLASNARTVPNVAYKLGWKPLKGEDAWEQAIRDELKNAAKDLGLL